MMARLAVYMNGDRVGTLNNTPSGAHQFQYDASWVKMPRSCPISLSMLLRQPCYQGDEVHHFFDNLLPDTPEVRSRVVGHYHANTTEPFDLLRCIGQDRVEALQRVTSRVIPLGMIREAEGFRISIPAAQEKTALLYIDGRLCLSIAVTPTTHIIKLPIGKIEGHSYSIDFSQSVENEYLCTLIAKECELPVPHCSIMQVNKIKALAVERFDRCYATDRSSIIRVPQEDFCQVLNVPSERKYESHSGPGIADIMAILQGSDTPARDRYLFMKSQVLCWPPRTAMPRIFWYSSNQKGGFRLAPLYVSRVWRQGATSSQC